ncbi:unnamed protein product, partial [Prorocentrum cordatum]
RGGGARPGRGRAQGAGRATGAASPGGPAPRWWRDIAEVCPLSGFPVSMLPYPPYKLHARAERSKDGVRLVDGPYLVLQVLATWDFAVIGQALTASDITSLDLYMKQCKLGPFRLGTALELQRDGAPAALRELQALRARARRRLESVQHIQRVRLGKWAGSPRGAAASGGGRAAAAAPRAAAGSPEEGEPPAREARGTRRNRQA